MKTTEEEKKQPPSSAKVGNPSQEGNKEEKEEVAKVEKIPAAKEVKGKDKKQDKDTEQPPSGSPQREESASAQDKPAPAKAAADKPTEEEKADGEEAPPKKKRKSERQEEAALIEDEGEAIEIKVEAKAEMDVKIQNGHVSISTGKVDFPVFGSGDTITIHYKIREGSKERIQQFQGVVIQRKGTYTTETCTIRKVSGGIGVERIFPLHSPFIDKIVVNKRGKVRRARIFYLRKLKGKKARIEEKRQITE